MARGAKTTLKITGYDELLQDIADMEKDVEEAVESALKKAGELAVQEYEKVAEEHFYAGITKESIVTSPKIKKREQGSSCGPVTTSKREVLRPSIWTKERQSKDRSTIWQK